MNHDTNALRELFDELVSLAAYEWARTQGLDLSTPESTTKVITQAARWRERFEYLTCPNHHHGLPSTGHPPHSVTLATGNYYHHNVTGSTCTHTAHNGAYGW